MRPKKLFKKAEMITIAYHAPFSQWTQGLRTTTAMQRRGDMSGFTVKDAATVSRVGDEGWEFVYTYAHIIRFS